MAVASLKYDAKSMVDQTRDGAFIYDGTATRFHEWEFRTRIKWNAKPKAVDKPEVMAKMIDGLRDEAAQIAMDIGQDDLMCAEGLDNLVKALKANAFPQQLAEAKELYRVGHLRGGPLSRQASEPMVSFISRRRRWWNQLKALDDTVELSTTIRGDLMLESANLSDMEQLMVLTSNQNKRDFETIATALLEQHSKKHMHDRGSRHGNGGEDRRPKGKGKGNYRSYQGNRYQRFANMSQHTKYDKHHDIDEDYDWRDEDEEEYYPEEEEDYDEEQEDGDEPQNKEDVEMEVFTALICQDEKSSDTDPDLVAELIQTETVAFQSWTRFSKGRGKGGRRSFRFGGKGKGKGKKSLEERKKALAKLKSETKCKECGEKGHWAGDFACKKKKEGKGTSRVGSLANREDERRDSCCESECDVYNGGDSEEEENVEQEPEYEQEQNQESSKEYLEACYHAYNELDKAQSSTESEENEERVAHIIGETRTAEAGNESASDRVNIQHTAMMNQQLETPCFGPGYNYSRRQETEIEVNGFTRFKYGPYNGSTYIEVYNKDYEYVNQLREQQTRKTFPQYAQAFLDWCEAKEEAAEHSETATSSELAAKSKTKRPGMNKRYTRRGFPEKKEARCAVCTEFTTLGTNHMIDMITCLECGHSEQTPKKLFPKCSFEECKHENTDKRGSTKKEVKIFCKDCCIFLDSRPREEFEAVEKTGKKLQLASTKTQQLAKKILDEKILSKEAVERTFDMFRANLVSHVKDNGDQISSMDMIKILEEAIDLQLARKEREKRTASVPEQHDISTDGEEEFVPVEKENCIAYMMQDEYESDSNTNVSQTSKAKSEEAEEQSEQCSGPPEVPIKGRVAMPGRKAAIKPLDISKELPVVDIYKSPDIWICLDEGCNSNCHGDEWARDAERKLQAKNLGEFEWKHRKVKTFSGIGEQKVQTLGKRSLPAVFKMMRSGLLLPTTLESHEQVGGHPLLLSDHSQAKLGLVKDMRTGQVHFKDHDEEIEVYRAAGSGLKVINISHYPERISESMVVPKARAEVRRRLDIIDGKTTSTSQASKAGIHLTAAMNQTDDVKTEVKVNKKVFITVSSYGLIKGTKDWRWDKVGSFPQVGEEIGEVLERECSKWNWKTGKWGIDAYRFNHESESNRAALHRRMIEMFPEWRHDNVYFVNCLDMKDPAEEERLTNHTGYHPDTQLQCAQGLSDAEYKNLAEVIEKVCFTDELDNKKGQARLVIVPTCRKERHRSVAIRQLTIRKLEDMQVYLETQGVTLELLAAPSVKFPKHMCKSDCRECSLNYGPGHRLKRTYDEARRVFAEKFDNHFRKPSKGKSKDYKRPPYTMPDEELDLYTDKAKSKGKEKGKQKQQEGTQRWVEKSEPSSSAAAKSTEEWLEPKKKRPDPKEISELEKKDLAKLTVDWNTNPITARETLSRFLRSYGDDVTSQIYDRVILIFGRGYTIPSGPSHQEMRKLIVDIAQEKRLNEKELYDFADSVVWMHEQKRQRKKESATASGDIEVRAEEEDDSLLQEDPPTIHEPHDPLRAKRLGLREDRTLHMHACHLNCDATDNEWIDFDPADMPGDDIYELYHNRADGGKRNFVTYVGQEDKRKEMKIKAICKTYPYETKVGVPPDMKHMKKTTLAHYEGTPQEDWHIIEDRVDIKENNQIHELVPKGKTADKVVSFIQEPKRTRTNVAFYSQCDRYAMLHEDKVVTMNAKQKKICSGGLKEVQELDEALATCLKAQTPKAKMIGKVGRVLCLLPMLLTTCFTGVKSEVIDYNKTSQLAMGTTDAGTIISSFGYEGDYGKEQRKYLEQLDKVAETAKVVHFAEQYANPIREEYEPQNLDWYDCGGNLSFVCNDNKLAATVLDWSSRDKYSTPRSLYDVIDKPHNLDELLQWIIEQESEQISRKAFPAEMEQEEQEEKDEDINPEEEMFLDAIEEDEDIGDEQTQEAIAEEAEMLEEIPLPGRNHDERSRKREWLKLPRTARAAIRRMHMQFGHCLKEPLIAILKAARCPESYIKAAKHLRCIECERTKVLPKQTNKVALPQPYAFNDQVGIDINYSKDVDGTTYMFFNMVCLGTGFQIEAFIQHGHGTPRSLTCLDIFMQHWVSWAGIPKRVVSDRGLNNRGVFAKELSAAGVLVSSIGLEAPYQLGKTERHGGMWSNIMSKVVETREVRGETAMRMASAEATAVMNEQNRTGGFAPCQWVLGRKPRHAGEQGDDESYHHLSALEEKIDPTTIFAERMALRHAAKKAYVHADSSKRVASALLRKAAPKPGRYQVGDLVSFQRQQGSKGINRNRWSPASRIIGFEGAGNQIGWVICEGVPVCVAMDQVVPASDSQALAYRYLHDTDETHIDQRQQSFVDHRNISIELPKQEAEIPEEEAEDDGNKFKMSDARKRMILDDFPQRALREHQEKRKADDIQELEQQARLEQENADEVRQAEDQEIKEAETENEAVSVDATVDVVSTPTESRGLAPTESRDRTRSRTPTREDREIEKSLRDPQEKGLLETWQRTGTTGSGIQVLERKARPEQEFKALLAFFAERMPVPMSKGLETKNDKKEKRGKTLNYDKENKEIREGLDISRREEWEKWKKFTAGKPCKGKELQQLLYDGHVPIPTRWVDVDKASHKRRDGGPIILPEYKSRLCGRGDLEGIDGLRTDSPTAEIEAHHLLFSFAASNKLKIRTADISNAYFQGQELDRVLLLRPPSSGLPDQDYQDGETMILARVPIYGTQDAGRKFWQRFRSVILANQFRENKIAKALYVLEKDNDVKALMVTHVDDLCWAIKPGYEEWINNILNEFVVNEKKIETGNFRFCGKEIKQLEDFSIQVTCQDSTEQIGPVRYHPGGRKPDAPATEAEVGQMRSVVGSLGWIARQCRPDLSYYVSRLQGAVSRATLKDLKETNQALEQALQYSDSGILFRSDAISWADAIVVSVTDASFAQETVNEPDGTVKPHRTQKAFMNLLVNPKITKEDSAGCHIWSWRSLTDKRVSRATLQGEAHGMLSGSEMGDRLRAIIADCKGQLPDVREWQAVSSRTMRHLWLSDCESLVSHLKNPKNERLENVRLSIDIQGLKQLLWEQSDGTNLDELPPEELAENAVRWIDTSCMVVDCLTKKMSPEVLLKLTKTGVLELKPTVESQMLKLKKQKHRKEARTKKQQDEKIVRP